MPRVVIEEDYTARRNEILDVTRQLVYSKGYEQMSIQDILDALKISKGAFYHYFESKPGLLEALIDKMGDEAEATILPLLDDPNLSALEKLRHYFSTALQWKASQKDFMLALLRIWYSDDNAITRQKMFSKLLQRVSPSFTRVIRQGVEEGSFSADFPEQVTEICFYLILGLGDKFGEIILTHENGSSDLSVEERFHIMNEAVSGYTHSLERVLGAPVGSIELMDADSIRFWIN